METVEFSKVIEYILSCIDSGTTDDELNEKNLVVPLNAYRFMGILISVEMVNDIKSNPEHYRKLISENSQCFISLNVQENKELWQSFHKARTRTNG